MLKKLNNYKIEISLIIIVIGISCMLWSIVNIKSYTTYHIESKTPTNVVNNDIKNISKYIPYPLKGEYIGTINIPKINKTFPIYEGTTDDELKKGVGHFIESVLPGIKNNSVLSAHRDTLFYDIGKLKIGDIIIINMDIKEYVYEVINIKIVNKNDKTIIVPTEEAMLTLTTCYPFNYIGFAPDCYIVSSKLIDNK